MFAAFPMYEVKFGPPVGAGAFTLFIAWEVFRLSGKYSIATR
jgi:hypothetical protein